MSHDSIIQSARIIIPPQLVVVGGRRIWFLYHLPVGRTAVIWMNLCRTTFWIFGSKKLDKICSSLFEEASCRITVQTAKILRKIQKYQNPNAVPSHDTARKKIVEQVGFPILSLLACLVSPLENRLRNHKFPTLQFLLITLSNYINHVRRRRYCRTRNR